MFDLDRGQIVCHHMGEGLDSVLHLSLDHEQDRVVAQACVGSQQKEQIRGDGGCQSIIGGRVGAQELCHILAILAVHKALGEHFLHMKSSGHDQHVNFLTGSIFQCQSVTLDGRDVLCMDIDVLSTQCRVIVGRDHDTTASHLIVRGQFLSKFLVPDLDDTEEPRHEDHDHTRDTIHELARERRHGVFRGPVEHLVVDKVKEGNVSEHPLPDRVVAGISARHDIGGGPLVVVQSLDLLYNGRNDLDATVRWVK